MWCLEETDVNEGLVVPGPDEGVSSQCHSAMDSQPIFSREQCTHAWIRDNYPELAELAVRDFHRLYWGVANSTNVHPTFHKLLLAELQAVITEINNSVNMFSVRCRHIQPRQPACHSHRLHRRRSSCTPQPC